MENTRTSGSSPSTDPRQDDAEQIGPPRVPAPDDWMPTPMCRCNWCEDARDRHGCCNWCGALTVDPQDGPEGKNRVLACSDACREGIARTFGSKRIVLTAPFREARS